MNINEVHTYIHENASVSEVLNYYGLTRSGTMYLCPFHSDTHPSLSVDRNDRYWKCWACDSHGDAYSFVKKYEELQGEHPTRLEVLDKVNSICGLGLDMTDLKEKQSTSNQNLKDRLYSKEQQSVIDALERFKALGCYEIDAPDGKEGLLYLKNRGFTPEIIKKMELGFFCEKNEAQFQYIDPNILKQSGFVYESHGQLKGSFINRILIPIKDAYGHVIAFSGRAIHEDIKPKYLHSRSTEIFKRNNVLYNYSNARQSAQNSTLLIVEGFFDVAGSLKMGLDNCVATMGLGISNQQLSLIQKLKCSVILARDNDNPGREAALKEVPLLLNQGIEVSVIDLAAVAADIDPKRPVKDLWDLAQFDISKDQLLSHAVEGRQYLYENKYLQPGSGPLNASFLHQAWSRAKNDGFIQSSYDRALFRESAMKTGKFRERDLDEILDDQISVNIGNSNFQIPSIEKPSIQETGEDPNRRAVLLTLTNAIRQQVKDPEMVEWLRKHPEKQKDVMNQFLVHPEEFFSKDGGIDLQACISHWNSLIEYEKKTERETRISNLFQHSYCVTGDGKRVRMDLSSENRKIIEEAFQKQYLDKGKDILDSDEICIMNHLREYSQLIQGEFFQKQKGLIWAVRGQMYQGGIQQFSYRPLFIGLPFENVPDEYKNADGTDFKKIWIVDNRRELLKENIPDKKNSHLKSCKVVDFLIVKESRESVTLTVPGTGGKMKMDISKLGSDWKLLQTDSKNRSWFSFNLDPEKEYMTNKGVQKGSNLIQKWEMSQSKKSRSYTPKPHHVYSKEDMEYER